MSTSQPVFITTIRFLRADIGTGISRGTLVGVGVVPSFGGRPVGVLDEDIAPPPVGQDYVDAPVIVHGTALVRCSVPFSRGAALGCDDGGKAMEAQAGHTIVGHALADAAAGALCPVLLLSGEMA